VDFTVAGPATSVVIRYANGTTINRPMTVNGVTVDFPSTGTWDTWATATVPVSLGAGSQSVRLTSTTINGGPNVDSLTVVSAPQAVSYQAEDATISQGLVEANHTGFTGTGFVNLDNVVGSYVDFTVTGPASSVVVRYSNGTAVNRPMTVNGIATDFPSTGTWDTWATKAVPVSLGTGSQSVRMTSTTVNGGPNVDRIDIVPPSQLSVTIDGGSPASWRDVGDGVIEIDVPRDSEVLVHSAGTTPPLTIAPVPVSIPGAAWGLPT
jgi:uncharacterized lipoprotein NlpE involved in copper resistance